MNVALVNILNDSGVKEIVGRNPCVPKSEETEASYVFQTDFEWWEATEIERVKM